MAEQNLPEIQIDHGREKREPLEWSAPEYHYIHKGTDWYWAVGIITISLAAAAVLFNNILFAILIVLASFTMTLYASRKPGMSNIRFDENGATIDNYSYPYKEVESFGIDMNSIQPRILLKSHKLFMPFISIPLGGMDPDLVREYLRAHLPEEELSEPLLQKILEYLGF